MQPRFLKLTDSDTGNPIILAVDSIESVEPDDDDAPNDGSFIAIVGNDNAGWGVSESVAQIVVMLAAAGCEVQSLQSSNAFRFN